MSINPQDAANRFESQFGAPPEILARAPGRVNLIGEHTDYNHGYVLPMAIDRDTVIAARPRADNILRIYAANLDDWAECLVGEWERSDEHPWCDYIAGVGLEVDQLGKPVRGADMLVVGDVPIGAGLSSSASVEMAALAMFEALGDFALQPAEAAALGQRVENDFLGVSSGIMDQFVVRAAQSGNALFLDCRSLEYEQVPVGLKNAVFVIADTGVARGLAGSAYNDRVRECAEAVRILQTKTGRMGTHLRDFDHTDLERVQADMPEAILRRARHVISENVRTQEACAALRSGDAVQLGALFNASDRSLREDYAVTCRELDAMTAIARSLTGCYGSRMTGAGFGGCTVHLVESERVEAFCEGLLAAYQDQFSRQCTSFACRPQGGAEVFHL